MTTPGDGHLGSVTQGGIYDLAISSSHDDGHDMHHTNNYCSNIGGTMNTLILILGGVALLMVIMGFTMMTLNDMHRCDVCGRRFETDKGMRIHKSLKHD